MSKQFENPKTTKLTDETASDASATKKVGSVAQKVAEKSTKTVQQYDKNNSNLFSK
jgi:hypothetical protein